jgi:hypothetical protein
MRPLILVMVLGLAWPAASALEPPRKYVSDDGALTLFVARPTGAPEVHLMFGHGLLVAVDAELDGDVLEGTLGDDVSFRARLGDDAAHLTLRQDGVEESRTLPRQVGRAVAGDRIEAAPVPPGAAPLLALLALVPDTANARLGGVPGVSYADYAAALEAGPGPTPGTRAAFESLTDEQRRRWTEGLRRVQVGPPDLRMHVFAMIESLDELLGFEWFAVRRALGFGRPPTLGTVLAVDVEAERLAERLAVRGFTAAQLGGVTVWHRQEDGQANLAERAPADPFVGPLGMAARVAILPGHLVGTRFWETTHGVVGAATGQAPALADSPDYRTLAAAVGAEDGALIQVQFLGPLDVGFLTPDPFAVLREGLPADPAAGPALPPYGLAALADRQEGDDQVSLIALLYQDERTAAAAAEVLTERLASFRADELASWGAQPDGPRVHGGVAGHVAAIASVRYPSALAQAQGAPPGGAFTAWLQAILMREFDVLRIGP